MHKRIFVLSILGFAAAYLLYDKLWVSIIGSVIFALYGILDRRDYIKSLKRKTRDNFLDFLMCLEPLLKTSGTFSGAFTEAVADYIKFHGNNDISRILVAATTEFRLNKPTGEILGKIAGRLDIEDARMFAGSMAICELTGGNAVEITEKTTELIIGKTRILCDINTSLSGRIFEQKIITAMPFILLGIFRMASGTYLETLYTTDQGRMIMTAAGLMFITQWFIGKKIADIRV